MPFIFSLLLLLSFSTPQQAHAATLLQDVTTISKAKVLEIKSQTLEAVPGTDTTTTVQTLVAEVIDGPDKGSVVTFDNDFVVLKAGDLFYLSKVVSAESGQTIYSVNDAYRLNAILFFVILFVLLVVIFGGWQGIRGLVSLIGSLALVLLPGILHGISPIFLSIVVASLIIVVGSYITHGFTKTTTSAVLGMIITVALSGLLAYYAIGATHLTGFESEESVFLNLDTSGSINFVGLLLGGMLIGLLGVLYDAAIGQAVAVDELHRVAPHLSRLTIYKRAIRIGKEHIGALVNTLAIAYVGVSLPLLLLFSTSSYPILQLINRENFATEIIRTMIGSIGLVLAVPITTLIAVLLLVRSQKDRTNEAGLKSEEEALEHFEHHH